MRDLINIIMEAGLTKRSTTDLMSPAPMGTLATRSDTLTRGIAANQDLDISPDLMRDMANLPANDIIPDTDIANLHADHEDTMGLGFAEPRTPETLPMVIQNSIVAGGDDSFDPEWHQVRNLPGYVQNGLRAVSRQLFQRFTTTPLEDLQMIGTTLNPREDVQKMMAWIKHNGMKEDEMVIDLTQVMTGYTVKASIWRVEGFQFALCQDISGYYVYGWPETNREVTDHTAGPTPLQIG